MDTKMTIITDDMVAGAVAAYPRNVTGPFAGCPNPGAVLRWALASGNEQLAGLARNYCTTHHGACWNALCTSMPMEGWLAWYRPLEA